MKRVAIGAPIRNRAWVLPDYLQSLIDLEWPEKHLFFFENDSTDGTKEILLDFAGRYPDLMTVVLHDYARYAIVPGETRDEYGFGGYGHLAMLRNKFLDLFLLTGADFLFSVDSDVIVPPDALHRLMEHADENTIISAAISNIPGQRLDGRVPGNFMVSTGTAYRHPAEYPLSGLMDVDVTGAVYLIPRKVIEAGVRYGPHPLGEDIPFCEAARELGFRLLVLLDLQCEHRMERK